MLVLSGSIRSGSFNTRLAAAFVGELANHDCEITRITLADYPLPLYDADLENEKGIPDNAIKLAKQFATHQALVIVGPEYNASLTPLLKNTIDWISRVKIKADDTIEPYRGKIAAIASASPGALGGVSSLTHLRQVLVRLGVLVISEQLSVGQANEAFDGRDRLVRDYNDKALKAACKSLVEKASFLGL